MRKWLTYIGLASAAVLFAAVYKLYFGPILGIAFASTALLAALGATFALERFGYSVRADRRRRVIQIFAVFLVLFVFLDPMDDCLDSGGSWNWYSAHCRRE